MRTNIINETLRDDLTQAQLNKAINDAIKLWEGERFTFNEKRYLLDTVPEQEYYGITTADGEELLEIDSITITVSNYPYPLIGRTQQWFDLYQSPAATYVGQPDSYGIYGNQLRLYPIPDSAGPNAGSYEITVSALARLGPNPLSDSNDTNDWMTEGETLIREQAKLLLYRNLLRDETGVNLCKDAIGEAQWSLKRKMAGKTMVGSIKAWSL
jgi:hypothetical protein